MLFFFFNSTVNGGEKQDTHMIWGHLFINLISGCPFQFRERLQEKANGWPESGGRVLYTRGGSTEIKERKGVAES